MKKFFAFITITLVALSCQQAPQEEPYIKITPKAQTVSSDSNTITLTVESNGEWRADAQPYWLKAESSTGKSTKNDFKITVSENTDADSRCGRVVFTCGTASDTLIVTQAQKDKFKITSVQSFDLGKSACQIEITYSGNVAVESSVNVDWIRKVDTKGVVSGSVVFDVDANMTYDKREGVITLKAAGSEYQIPVVQQQSNGIILSDTTVELDPEGGNFQVVVNSNVDYKVSVPALGWVKTATTKGLSAHTEYFTASQNTNYDPRETQIIFYYKEVSDTLVVIQKERIGFFMDSEYREVSSTGETISVKLDRNVDYSTQISDSWIQAVPQTKGLVTETVQFNVLNNDSGDKRDGSIKFIPVKGETLTLYIHQDFTPVVEIVGVKSHNSSREGDSFEIKINANIPYDVVSSASWVTVDASNKVTVAKNDAYDAREATITFKNLQFGISDVFEVGQDANIGFFVNGGQKTIKAEGETFGVDVQYNVDYKVTISDSWIKQLPQTKGLASQTLQFKVEANADGAARNGYIAFEAEQGGFKDTLFVAQSFEPVLVLNGESSVEIGPSACVLTPDIKSNVKYTVCSDVKWITVNENGTLNIAENTAFDSRTGVVTWENAENKLSVSLTIKQDGKDHNTLVYVINGKKITLPVITGESLEGLVDWGDGSAQVSYSAGMSHTYSGSGDHTVTILLVNNDTVAFDGLDALKKLDLSKF